MAMAKATVNEVSFCFSISNISKLNDEVWSPQYLIDGVPWKVAAYKDVLDAKPSLGLYLYCAKSQLSSNWSHVASATFELVPFKNGCASRKVEIHPYVFDHFNKDFGFYNFIQWDNLFDAKLDYVKDDTINLRIQIRSELSKAKLASFESISKNCEEGCLSMFRVTVSNIESLAAVKTPEIVLQKVLCELIFFKRSNNLEVRLSGSGPLFSHNIKLSVELKANLVSSNAGTKPYGNIQGAIDRYTPSLDMPRLISWKELLEPKNEFIKDGIITIELEIKAKLLRGDPVSNGRKSKATDEHQPAAKHLKFECKICKKEIIDQDISSLPCGHVFCSPCITASIKARKVCPSCNVLVTPSGVRRILLSKLN